MFNTRRLWKEIRIMDGLWNTNVNSRQNIQLLPDVVHVLFDGSSQVSMTVNST
jgi:hypothetical protein